ncbi:hypothetical protein BS78_01G040700 [Paspalum vaginatum]|nr:hypothetical protein BS78_01G040700 [Paspalum vaginatum]
MHRNIRWIQKRIKNFLWTALIQLKILERIKNSKLFPRRCIMDGCTVDIMIKKGSEIKKETYDIMKTFRHNTSIPHLNYYSESNQGRLVIPLVGALFESWINTDGWGLLIKEDGSMSSLFKTMIIDICDLVESLYKHKILIKNLDWKNLYMAKEATPRILLLVTEAEILTQEVPKAVLWKPIRDIMGWCYEKCKISQNRHAQRYIGFIGKDSFSTKSLKRYPENWDNYTKGDYLLSLIAANQNDIRRAIRQSNVSWPKENGVLPDLLKQIIEHESYKGRYYDPKIQFDYISLMRNVYKHFDKFPLNIKRGFGENREGFINMLEHWTPTIWECLPSRIYGG